MGALGTPGYGELESLLAGLGSKLAAPQVHALYLGALTSTSFRLGPQHLMEQIFGEDGDIGPNPMETLPILLGYWNTLLTEKDAGRVHLAHSDLPHEPTKNELVAYATRRNDELTWYVRGIDAGGDDPTEFGDEGATLLAGIAEAGAYLVAYVELLGRIGEPSVSERRDARARMLDVVAAAERLIAKLMAVSDAVRREALAAFREQAGRATDDGARVAAPVRVGRNEKCPCGSGKKSKRCCGAAGRVQ